LFTPGMKFSRFSPALLPWRMGMLKIRSCERLLSVELLVTSTTGASPRTSTVSVMPPTFSAKSTLAVLPMVTTTFSRRSAEKPLISTRSS
jgi:hypothetical protein